MRTLQYGGSSCSDMKFNGKAFCYTEKGVCSDGAMLVRQYGVAATGYEWSYKVCEGSGNTMLNTGINANIVERAILTTSLSTLVVAVQTAGLVNTLSGAGPFTVFAPSNKAFEAVPKYALEALLKPANKDKLVDLLNKNQYKDRNFLRKKEGDLYMTWDCLNSIAT